MTLRELKSRVPLVFGLACLVAVTGCATYSSAPRSYDHFWTQLQVALPEGWLQYNPESSALVITKDGLQLEQIRISMTRAGKRLEDTERRYQRGMLPHEIAELSLALLEAREDTNDFEIEKMDFATIAGHDGFHATARFLDESGLKKRVYLYGAMLDGYVFELLYVAAEQVYFEKYRPAFEHVVASASLHR